MVRSQLFITQFVLRYKSRIDAFQDERKWYYDFFLEEKKISPSNIWRIWYNDFLFLIKIGRKVIPTYLLSFNYRINKKVKKNNISLITRVNWS